MSAPAYLDTPTGRLAYHHRQGTGPTVIFCGGYKSDMEGSKAVHLQNWAAAAGRSYVRFDYRGHGHSDGAFEDGCIGDWAADAAAIMEMISGPVLLVGSSMGGWIALLLAKRFPERVAGLVTIAAAPDFTEDSFWAGFDADQRAALDAAGYVDLPSDYDEPYRVTKRLIEDGRRHLVLRSPLSLGFPVRFLQGTADSSVSIDVALRLLDHAAGPDMRLTLVDGADHSFSTAPCLDLITDMITELS